MKKLFSIALAALLLVSCASVLFVASAEATNVAPKATYEVHEWFRMGGQDVGWGYDASADISYPDSDHELTDGVLAEDCSYGTAAWIGLNQSHPDFKDTAKPLYIDFKLDQAYDVGTIRISLNNLNDAGIGAPVAVTAQASEDGEAVQGAYTAEPVAGEHCTYEITLNQNTAFVRLNFYSQACANNAVAAGNEPAWLAALADANKKNTWTFIDEVEIYDDGEAAAETIVETIDVDGDLDDTGWAEDGWVRVDGEEAIQGSPEGKEPQPFSIQLRTDDEWLYVGVIYEQPMTKGAAASASGSRLRMWFHNSDEYDRYTHFYDIWPDENGDTCTLAKYNTAKDANSGAVLENSSVKGKITEKDGYTYFEFAVKYSEFLLEGQDTSATSPTCTTV